MNAKQIEWRSRARLGLLGLAVLGLLAIWAQAYAEDEERGYLGIYLEQLDDETRESLKFKGEGVFVDDVVSESPAQKAGLEDGDIITRFNDTAVKGADELRELIGAAKPGDKVTLVIYRDGKEQKLTAELGETEDVSERVIIRKRWPGHPGMMTMKGGCCGSGECGVWLGVEVQKLSDQLAEYFKIKDGQGMLVSTAVEGAPAQKAGIKAGDVIVKIGDEEISNRADLREAICGKKAGDEVEVSLVRDGQKRTLKVTLAEMPEDYAEKKADIDKRFMWFGPEGLDLDLERLGPELEQHLQALPRHLEGSMDDLQEQLDALKKDLEKLKLQVENK